MFNIVFAFPKVSNIVIDFEIMVDNFFEQSVAHRYSAIFCIVSVLPAPDTPVISIDWETFDIFMDSIAFFANFSRPFTHGND